MILPRLGIVVVAGGLCASACDRRLDAGGSDPDAAASADAPAAVDGNVTGAMVLNGNARLDNGALILTDDRENQVGSAFLPQAIAAPASGSLWVRVVFQMTVSSIAADGFAVVVQGTTAGPRALGGTGGGLGYFGFSPSLAVEVDTHDELGAGESEHLALVRDGDNYADRALAQTNTRPLSPSDGSVHTLWVRFAPDRVEAWLAPGATSRPATPMLQAAVPVRDHFPGPVWIGLTASTGAKYAEHRVLEFVVSLEP
jgi:hypothetical protein